SDLDNLSGVAIASVVPSGTAVCERFCRDHLQIRPFIITGNTPTRLTIAYRPAKSLGPDRLVSALAACEVHSPPVICASLGTATVIDAVSGDYEFLGGAILPGLQLMTESLA
ncbi:MAG: type III pantothenate kinase, partial [Armatimonadetes bacterium]|nr:type III pantothenate kinase [Armatimonadota bacterium]NIM23926.1 type III pantothenate kinase [Armatimonadota bacterium]NIM67773.1 type III pantothenate kinase [Armatimonadota bacterium]NIM76313.1 type III pantothenate kinase [Armatimonadota bacterium]NIN06007.1 type III pantothenate kinase [Armatimonadota bacterium]